MPGHHSFMRFNDCVWLMKIHCHTHVTRNIHNSRSYIMVWFMFTSAFDVQEVNHSGRNFVRHWNMCFMQCSVIPHVAIITWKHSARVLQCVSITMQFGYVMLCFGSQSVIETWWRIEMTDSNPSSMTDWIRHRPIRHHQRYGSSSKTLVAFLETHFWPRWLQDWFPISQRKLCASFTRNL